MLKIGAKAPAFTLPDQDGKSVSLADLAGEWTVLYFYPRDDTPGCTVQACEFTASMPAFDELDAKVFGCSADGASAHQKFITKHRLGIPLLTDADRSVMKSYGAYGEKVMYGKPVVGVIRSTVLIAPDGTVAHHWPKVKAAGHAEQVRARLAELRSGGASGAASGRAATKPNTAKGKAGAVKPKTANAAQPPRKSTRAAAKSPAAKNRGTRGTSR